MGLMSKIEDKLSSNKHDSERSSYDDKSGTSHLRHPVSSGTGNDGYGSSTTGSSGTHGYGSSTIGTTGGSGLGTSGGVPGSYDDAGRSERDGYGHPSGGYRKTDTAGGLVTSGGTDARDNTSGRYSSGTREPIDPYSSRGQQTAANVAHGYSGGNMRDNYGGDQYANEPNMLRTRDGGGLNPSSDPSSRNPDAIPTAGGHRVGASNVNDPHSANTFSGRNDPHSSTHKSSGHPIRDAAVNAKDAVTGHGSSRHHDNRSHNDPSTTGVGHYGSPAHPQDTLRDGYLSSNTFGATSGAPPESKKVGNAYEAGYRDAMEHAKADLGRQ